MYMSRTPQSGNRGEQSWALTYFVMKGVTKPRNDKTGRTYDYTPVVQDRQTRDRAIYNRGAKLNNAMYIMLYIRGTSCDVTLFELMRR